MQASSVRSAMFIARENREHTEAP